jgi:hypothetical protein
MPWMLPSISFPIHHNPNILLRVISSCSQHCNVMHQNPPPQEEIKGSKRKGTVASSVEVLYWNIMQAYGLRLLEEIWPKCLEGQGEPFCHGLWITYLTLLGSLECSWRRLFWLMVWV